MVSPILRSRPLNVIYQQHNTGNVMLSVPLFVTLFVALFAASFCSLKIFFATELVLNLSASLLAGVAAYVVTRGIAYFLPKKIVSTSNKVVFITGCDSGFGHELAKNLDALGFHVYAGCLFPDQKGATELKEKCSERLRVVKLDVTSDEVVEAAAKEVESTLHGKVLWSVVNNAGIANAAEIEWCPIETYQKIMDVNTFGPIRVTKAFLPMLRKSCGRVVIVASLAGRCVTPGVSAYSVSKSAVISFADSLRREMKKWDVTVHCVEPSIYRTHLNATDHILPSLERDWLSATTEIRESYGEKYYKSFQRRIVIHHKCASENIGEVVDDMIDAVAGQEPKLRYYPGILLQIQARFLLMLPTALQDYILCHLQPRCIPAARQSTVGSRSQSLLDKIALKMLLLVYALLKNID